MFVEWFEFCKKQCAQCDKSLVGDQPQSLIFTDGDWYHERCLLRAKHALADAMRLARLGYAISVYVASREDLEAVHGIQH